MSESPVLTAAADSDPARADGAVKPTARTPADSDPVPAADSDPVPAARPAAPSPAAGPGTAHAPAPVPPAAPYDVDRWRADFPILAREINGHPLVYLDSANTSQKPQAVIDAVADHYARHNANVARAMHTLGAEATAAFEGARATVASFIGAQPEEVVFTKNASEALNLAAHTLGAGLKPGDEVVVSIAEHHSNIVPWQLACQRSGATLRWFDLTAEGRLDVDRAEAEGLINGRTKVVAVTWVSNVTGAVTPVTRIVEAAHRQGAVVVLDGSQAVPHRPTDVATLGVDLLAFTGHKMCGPTGIGVLWGRYDLLAALPPFLGGGEMIEVVKMEGSTYARPPHRFEAGTPPIAQAVGLAAAIDYLTGIGLEAVWRHEQEITAHALARLAEIPEVRVLGPTAVAGPGVSDWRGSAASTSPAPGVGEDHRRADWSTPDLAPAPGVGEDPRRADWSTPDLAPTPGVGEDRPDSAPGRPVPRVATHPERVQMSDPRSDDSPTAVGVATNPEPRGGAVSFALADIHPHDVMQVFDSLGVAVRGGHHCARPLHERFGVQSSVRASGYLYTTAAEIDRLVEAVEETLRFFRVRPGGRV